MGTIGLRPVEGTGHGTGYRCRPGIIALRENRGSLEHSDHVATVAKRYSANAEAYHEHWAPVLARPGRWLIEWADIAGAERVLDLGSGVGTLLPELAQRAPRAMVIGADRAEGMLRLAPASFPRVVLDATALCFHDAEFDAVVMAFMLFHVLEPAAALAEVRRALRPGGVLALATWNAGDNEWIADTIWTEELDAHGADPIAPSEATHDLMNTPARMVDLLESAGFRDVETDLSPVVDAVDSDGYLTRRTGLGLAAARFRSMAPSAQRACLDRMRSRLDDLSDEEMASREVAILTRATNV